MAEIAKRGLELLGELFLERLSIRRPQFLAPERQRHAVDPSDRALSARSEAGEHGAVSDGQSLQHSRSELREAEDLGPEVREADLREVEGRNARRRRAGGHAQESTA